MTNDFDLKLEANRAIGDSERQVREARDTLGDLYSKVSGDSLNGDVGEKGKVLGKIADAMLEIRETGQQAQKDLKNLIKE